MVQYVSTCVEYRSVVNGRKIIRDHTFYSIYCYNSRVENDSDVISCVLDAAQFHKSEMGWLLAHIM